MDQLIINGDTPVTAGPTTIPPGAVIASTLATADSEDTILDGVVYRAADPGNLGRRGAVEATGDQAELLEELLGL